MYIPKYFANTDHDAVIAFIRKYSFGLIVTAHDHVPVASHLPFLIEESKGEVVITSHLAKANPQAERLIQHEVMVVFSQPHAYISPRHYDQEQNVPTWNYLGRYMPMAKLRLWIHTCSYQP